MDTVILDVRGDREFFEDFARAWKTGAAARAARISFATPELLWKVLTAKRWEILKAMTGAGSLGVRELARRVGRNVKGVHADVTALLQAGVIERTEGGKLLFPYQHVEVRFKLDAAA